MGKLLQLKTSPPNKAALIDEFGDVERLRREFAPTERRYQQLRDEIAGWCPDPEKEYVEKGHRYELLISRRDEQRKVDVKAAQKKLGLTKFLKACSLTMKALEAFLPKPEIEALTTKARTGPRTLIPTPVTPAPDIAPEKAA